MGAKVLVPNRLAEPLKLLVVTHSYNEMAIFRFEALIRHYILHAVT